MSSRVGPQLGGRWFPQPPGRWLPLGLLLPAGLVASSVSGSRDIREAGLRCSVVALACLTASSFGTSAGLSSAASLYVALFSLFHFSLFGVVAFLGPERLGVEYQYLLGWLGGAVAFYAAGLAAMGLVGFTTAALVVLSVGNTNHGPSFRAENWDQTLLERLGARGLALQFLGLGLWAWQLIVSGGFSALSLTYGQFLSSATGLASWGSWMVGLGFALSPFGKVRVQRVAIVSFTIFALILFPLGLRGTVLFPLAAWLASRSAANRKTPTLLVAAGGAALMVVSAGVRAVRDGNAAVAKPTGVVGSLIDAFSELGGSIFPTVLTIRWREAGLPADHFTSFAIVLIRQWELLVVGHRLPGDQDMRIFNVEITNRAGPYGGSPIAEGYHALGLPGVLITMVILGSVVGLSMRRQEVSVAWLGYSAAIMLPLFVNVRNSFAQVPPQIAMGVVFVFLSMHVTRRLAVNRPSRNSSHHLIDGNVPRDYGPGSQGRPVPDRDSR